MSWAEYRQHLEKLSKLCGIAFYEDDDVFFSDDDDDDDEDDDYDANDFFLMMMMILSPFLYLRAFLKDDVSPTKKSTLSKQVRSQNPSCVER